MRLLVEVNLPFDYEGKEDLRQAKEQIFHALEILPTSIDQVDRITVPVRDINGNRIGRLTVDQEVV